MDQEERWSGGDVWSGFVFVCAWGVGSVAAWIGLGGGSGENLELPGAGH